jgi:hypothetical protein
VIIDRLTRRHRKRNRVAKPDPRSRPRRYWNGDGWSEVYLHAQTFISEEEARAYVVQTFGRS